MRVDSFFYKQKIFYFEKYMSETFGEAVEKLTLKHAFEHRGFFELVYKYFPHNYTIVIENEFRAFDITIIDSEGAKNSLYRIQKFENTLDEKCIAESMRVLKKVLDKNDFCFYFCVEDNLYRKTSTGVQAVDLTEFLD